MSKYLAAILLAVLLLWPAHARPQFYPIRAPDLEFACGLVNIGATLTECQAIPTLAAQSYYITDVKVQTTTTTSGTYAIQSGTGTNCGTNTTVVFPKSGSGSDRFNAPITTSAMANVDFRTPIKIAAGHAICMIGVGTNTISIYIAGYVR